MWTEAGVCTPEHAKLPHGKGWKLGWKEKGLSGKPPLPRLPLPAWTPGFCIYEPRFPGKFVLRKMHSSRMEDRTYFISNSLA